MAKVRPRDRFLPCLLDRLVDDRPHISVDEDPSRTFNVAQLRSAVLRDLSWLLNTRTKMPRPQRRKYPIVSRSVVNFGLDDVCGRDYEAFDLSAMEQEIRQLIIDYEPRLIPSSIRVSVVRRDQQRPTALYLEIQGALQLTPVPEELLVRTTLDTESGKFELTGG